MIDLVVDNNTNRQRQALKTIATIGEDAKPALSLVLAFAEREAQQVTPGSGGSRWSLEVIRTLLAIAPEDRRVFRVLLSCLDSENLATNSADQSQLEAAISLPRTPFKKESVRVLVTMLRQAPDSRMRTVAAKALGEIGPDAKDAVKYLEAAKIDSNAEIREAVGAALKAIKKD